MDKRKCKYCNGTGIVQVAPNARGIKECPYCKNKRNENKSEEKKQ